MQPIDRNSLGALADSYDIDLIVMFGSRARGQSAPHSDTDIAIRSKRELTVHDELAIATALEKFFPEVDLCNISRAKPLLLGAIGQDAKLIYQRNDSLFEEFKIFAWNVYTDFKPQLTRIRERNRAAIEKL